LWYRGFNREAGSEFSTLTNPEEAAPKIGLKDKIVSAGKNMFELEQQARVPNQIECLCDVENDPRNTVLTQGRRKWCRLYEGIFGQ
jgi:hypothetical protein